MGIDSSKKEILKIIENSVNKLSINEETNMKIDYRKVYNEDSDIEKEKNLSSEKNKLKKEENLNESFDLSFEEKEEEIEELCNPKFDVKNLKEFPFHAIGIINVQFPAGAEIFEYTCFLIDTNVVVTLASNLENKSKGGKAKLILTSFSEEHVIWENIFFKEIKN